jgi:hypothetical protein
VSLGGLVFIGLGAVIVTALALSASVIRIGRSRSPRALSWRLTKPGASVGFRVGPTGGCWNPAAGTGPRSFLYGAGHASYTKGPDGLIHLRMSRPDGSVEEFTGPSVDE